MVRWLLGGAGFWGPRAKEEVWAPEGREWVAGAGLSPRRPPMKLWGVLFSHLGRLPPTSSLPWGRASLESLWEGRGSGGAGDAQLARRVRLVLAFGTQLQGQ